MTGFIPIKSVRFAKYSYSFCKFYNECIQAFCLSNLAGELMELAVYMKWLRFRDKKPANLAFH